jgi:sigma-B regulation protein RsbU (phosphoserine phosphatase)
MRFRTTVLLAMGALVALLLGATVSAVAVLLERAARHDVEEDLARGQRVLSDLLAYRQSLYRSEARVVGEEPRLKAVVDTRDVTHETVLGVVQDVARAIRADFFLLTDGAGRLLADIADPEAVGFDLGDMPVVKAALGSGDASGILTSKATAAADGKPASAGRAWSVEARRLTFGTQVVGVSVVGHELGDRVVETLFLQTGDSVVIELDGHPLAVPPLDGGVVADRAALQAALAQIPRAAKAEKASQKASTTESAAAPTELVLQGVRYLALDAPFPGYTGTGDMRYRILRSLDRALEPARRVQHVLYGIAAAALAFALLAALLLSQRLSRPVHDLVGYTERIASGALKEDGETVARHRWPVELRSLGQAMDRMVGELATSREAAAEQLRLQRELEIANRIQTSLVPREIAIPGVRAAARMIPADEVGGDYYDVIPTAHGAWIGIGDVAGHGLTAGLVMMMIQSIVAALLLEQPDASPREILRVLNAVLYDNIRRRLGQDEHVTLTLVRYDADGTMQFAGAHEEIVVCRRQSGRCERVPTPGTWLGAAPDVARFMVDSTIRLEPGDLMLLYTDGLIQAMRPDGEQFGMERMCELVEERRAEPVSAIRDALLEAMISFAARVDDDVTLLVLRYEGSPPSA